MNNAYYMIGSIHGFRLLLEIPEDKEQFKSIVYDTIQSGDVIPKYVAVDIKKNAVMFERQYPKIDLDLVRPSKASDFRFSDKAKGERKGSKRASTKSPQRDTRR